MFMFYGIRIALHVLYLYLVLTLQKAEMCWCDNNVIPYTTSVTETACFYGPTVQFIIRYNTVDKSLQRLFIAHYL